MIDQKTVDAVRKLKESKHPWAWSLRAMGSVAKSAQSGLKFLFIVNSDNMDLRCLSPVIGAPDWAKLQDETVKAMLAPEPIMGAGKVAKQRPPAFWFEDADAMAQMQPMLSELGIDVQLMDHFEPIDQLISVFGNIAGASGLDLDEMNDMATAMETPPPPDHRVGLLDIPNMTEPLAREVYAAATEFFKAEPWEDATDTDFFALRYEAPGEAAREYIAVIMGSGELEYGVAFFRSLDHLNAMLAVQGPEDLQAQADDDGDDAGGDTGKSDLTSLGITFAEKEFVLKQDVDAQKKYRWPLPKKNTYPSLTDFGKARGMRSPSREDIVAMTATLRLLPSFIARYGDQFDEAMSAMEAGGDLSLWDSLTLPEVYNGATISVSYPVPGVEFPEDELIDLDELFGDVDEDGEDEGREADSEFDEDEDGEDSDDDGNGPDASDRGNNLLNPPRTPRKGPLWG